MRYLVTGGCGFIGSNLVRHLVAQDHEVVVLDDLSSSSAEQLSDLDIKLVTHDVSRGFAPDEPQIDAVFHQAAITDPRYPDGEALVRSNLGGFAAVLTFCVERDIPLVYASTANLYGNTPAPQREDSPKHYFTEYGFSKLAMDEMASHHWHARRIVGLRYFNVFGLGEGAKGRTASMVHQLALQIAAGQRPRLFRAGEQRRDHVYVEDCVRANLLALAAPSGVYNIGTGTSSTFNDLVTYLNSALGTSFEPEYFENPFPNYQSDTCADLSRSRKYLGYEPTYSTEQGIHDFVRRLKRSGSI